MIHPEDIRRVREEQRKNILWWSLLGAIVLSMFAASLIWGGQ